MINLFWTGGFDSTYRLLEILLVEGKSVQTYYILDAGRPSTFTEIKAMESIKDALLKSNPAVEGLLQPLKLELKSNIRPNPEITAQYNRVAAQAQVGTQYEWLARYVDEHQIFDMELCMTKLSAEQMSGTHTMINPELTGQQHECRLRDELQNKDLAFFRYFRFPTIHLTKAEMVQLAEQRGYNDFLSQTWYCHTPTPEGLPCGYCVPCTVRKVSGISHQEAKRPLRRRVMGRMKRILTGSNFLAVSILSVGV